jgi:hypothetical protein
VVQSFGSSGSFISTRKSSVPQSGQCVKRVSWFSTGTDAAECTAFRSTSISPDVLLLLATGQTVPPDSAFIIEMLR